MKYIDNRLKANIVKLEDTNNNYTSENVEGALEEIDSKIKIIEANAYDDTKYKKYSLGMKQRLGIAAAVFEQPDIILLDEPTNALDESGITMLENVIQDETSRGATIVMASHDMNFLHHCCSKIYTMRAGTLSL